jgi:tRNA-2-methylthio-N6-dimethylallyladenosine synthase
MNESDSEIVRAILECAGWRFVDEIGKANVILLNTCSVRESATRKVFGHIHDMRHQLKGKPILIGILGCIATDAKKSLFENKKLGIDFSAGPDSDKKLPLLIEQTQTKKKLAEIDLSPKEDYSDINPARTSGVNAWVTIMRGCDNFCSFCIVPYVRGRERSRSHKSILGEIKRLAKEGYQQVTLLGQNVTSYHADNYDFPKLLDEISQIKGLKRIRFMSPHPKDFSPKLIDLVATRPNICKYIHLPLQSGSSRILKLMNRKYTKAHYLSLANKIKKECPSAAITTDIIVGFPTETEKDFNDTVDVLKKVRFDSAFIFKYSPRNGTTAERRYKDDVTSEVKTKRIMLLNELQKSISLAQNEKMIGRIETVLIDTKKAPGLFYGRTDANKLVSCACSKCKVGQLVDVKISDASISRLNGRCI